MARIYADHAATTPVRDDVMAAMLPHFSSGFNPGSPHADGRAARAALDDARASVARSLGARPREIVFTGGGSEAIALAIFGTVRAARPGPRHIVTAATEHHAVLRSVEMLAREGHAVTVIGVDASGRIRPAELEAALRPDTALVSLMLANNELGTLHPIAELSRIVRARGIVFHTDAIQAPGRIVVDVEALGVDLLTLAGHKFFGPKGVGVLYVRAGVPIEPIVPGGAQEAGLRAGTENVAGAVGLARALELAVAELPTEVARLDRLRDRFEAALRERIAGARVNADDAPRLPGTTNVAFFGVDAVSLIVGLDLAGVSVSAGSACAAGATEPSHVLAAVGAPAWVRAGSVRFSFGKLTSEEDVERLITMLPEVVSQLRVENDDLGTSASGADLGRPEVRF